MGNLQAATITSAFVPFSYAKISTDLIAIQLGERSGGFHYTKLKPLTLLFNALTRQYLNSLRAGLSPIARVSAHAVLSDISNPSAQVTKRCPCRMNG